MLSRRSILGAALVLSCAAGAALSILPAAGASTTAMKEVLHPAVVWSGDHTELDAARFERITDGNAWRTFWTEHMGERAARNHLDEVEVPRVDFERQMAIVIVGEEQTRCRGVHVETIVAAHDTILVHFAEPGYGISYGFGKPEAAPKLPTVRPYAIAIVPKHEGELVFKRGTFDKQTNSYVRWEEVATAE